MNKSTFYPQAFTKDELKLLYRSFNKLDTNLNHLIDEKEMLEEPRLMSNPIVKRIWKIFDKNKDNKISFFEFVEGLSTLTMGGNLNIILGNHYDKIKFAFKVYDINEDGFISNSDLFHALKLFVADNLTDYQIQQLADRTMMYVDKDLDGFISYDEFVEFMEKTNTVNLFTFDMFGSLDTFSESDPNSKSTFEG